MTQNPYTPPAATSETPAAAKTDGHSRSFASITLAVIAIGLSVLAEGAILASRHRFVAIFEEFEMDIPVIARFAIGPVLPLLLGAVILTGSIKELIPALRPAVDKWNLAILLFGLGCLAIYVVSIFAPLMTLITGLSA